MRVPGPTLLSIAKVAKTLAEGYDAADFVFEVQGEELRICGGTASRTLILKATFAIQGGPAEAVTVVQATKRFEEAAKVFAKDESVDMEIVGAILKLSTARKKRTVACVDLRYASTPKFPQGIPWTATGIVLDRAWLKSVLDAVSSFDIMSVKTGKDLIEVGAEGSTDSHAESQPSPGVAESRTHFSPEVLANAIGTATGEHITLDAGLDLPAHFSFFFPGGKAEAVVANIQVFD